MSSLPPQSAKGACFLGFRLPVSQSLKLLGQPYLLIRVRKIPHALSLANCVIIAQNYRL